MPDEPWGLPHGNWNDVVNLGYSSAIQFGGRSV